MSHIILDHVSLNYPVFGANGRSFKSGIFNMATGGRLAKSHGTITVEALHDIHLNLQSGDRLGLVGHNGAGKTTLLKVLAQIFEPTQGTISVKGNSNCLFDIMMGMDIESNGYENIMLRGLILGLTRTQVKKIIPSIEEFADLGDFISMPIKTYSAGMKVRLAFGIITSMPAEILLIDEVVNVGDANFMEKAKQRMHGLIHQSDILVLSTHDVNIMKEFCNKVLWLEHGTIRAFGPITDILEQYSKSQGPQG
ncbi:MAG: ABC transporter ATP-binding protein [Gammaproteobacteria bacterium]|nr:ABC transporter ATP-binding protein [Gammaproteobacteria bacterium]